MKRFLILCFTIILSLALLSVVSSPRVTAQEQRQRGLQVQVGATSQEAARGSTIRRWAVVIGISRYKYGNQSIEGVRVENLKNAADDAQKFYNFLCSPEGGDFCDPQKGGNAILLKDEQATKAAVEKALNQLKASQAEDYFVIYIAAHGANIPLFDPKLNISTQVPHFILYDFDPRDVANTAIRMEAFRQLVSQIPARKGMVISDTCHSAGVMLAGRGLYTTTGAHTTFINEMSNVHSGVGFISAAGQLEFAQENDELGGVFTYCLLEGLRGNADVNPPDGIITFGEINTYLLNRVPELTQGKQHPYYNTTTLETNKIPLAIVRYPQAEACHNPVTCGTMVVRTPDLDGVEVAVNGLSLGTFTRNLERTVRLPQGEHLLSFTRGGLRRDLKATVEPGKSKIVEVNLSFSESTEQSLVEPSSRQIDAFLPQDKPPTKEAERIFKEGVDEFNKQRFEEAIRLFDRAMQANGGAFANALTFRGRAEQSLRRNEQAVRSFSEALKLRPSDFETKTLLAEAKFNAGYNVEEVINDLKEVINRHPNFDFARVVYGDVLLARNQFAAAEQQLRSAIAINPKSPPARLILANTLLYMDSKTKQREAVTEAEKALRLFEELAQKKVSVLKGLKYLSLSHIIFGGARYANEPALAEAHYILGKALTRVVEGETVQTECESSLNVATQGDYLDRARQHLKTALELAQKLGDRRREVLVLSVSAQNYLLKGDLARAIEDGEKALQRAATIPDMKDFPEAHFTLYDAYKSDQKFLKAADHLQAYIASVCSSPANQEACAGYRAELEQLKRLASALRQTR